MKTELNGMTLEHLYEICERAHAHTSFSPEKRAEGYVREYSKLLDEDLKELGENQGNYKEKFISKFSRWMHAKGNCISSMITGGSNFPVRRAEKANRSEHMHSEEFHAWRERYFKAVNRIPTKSPEDEQTEAERKLETLVNIQLEAKEINAAARKFKENSLQEVIAHLVAEGYNPKIIGRLDERGGKFKIPAYFLTNNNAKIKSTQIKVKIMQNRINRKDTWEDIDFEGGYVTIEDDRVKIYHEEKPSTEIRTEIKRSGFKWSPNWACWCRKHTENALFSVKHLSFIKEHAEALRV